MASAGKAASMEPINEEELDESSLFPAVDPLDAPEDDSEGEESSSDDLDDPTSLYAPRRQGIDVAGMQRESAKSSTLDISLEDSFNRDHEDDHMSMGGAGMRTRMYTETSQPHRNVSQSLPVHSSAIRMGSSVPIGIPLMARWNNTRESVGGTIAAAVGGRYHNSDEAYYAHDDDAKFTPPHELSQRNELASMTGDGAPNASMKRDLLRHRNAVLRSTGFLEANTNFTFLPVAGSSSDRDGANTMVAGSLPATRHMAAGMAGAYGSRAGAGGSSASPALFGGESGAYESRPRPRAVGGASALSAALGSRQ